MSSLAFSLLAAFAAWGFIQCWLWFYAKQEPDKIIRAELRLWCDRFALKSLVWFIVLAVAMWFWCHLP